jgi:hypothetical protein
MIMKRNKSTYLGALVFLCTALAVADGLWAQESPQRPEMIPPGKVTTGALEYRRYCAPCHGPDGEGNGPVAPALKNKPADLTQIAQAHYGKFPKEWVWSYIDGTIMIPAHGTSDMHFGAMSFPRAVQG